MRAADDRGHDLFDLWRLDRRSALVIPMARPLIGDAEIEAVTAVLRSGQLAQGRVVEEFEERFAELCGVHHAVATTSGTTALHVALLAHGIGAGDEVITTSFSFIASANAALYVGARPVFADIDPNTLNIDPDDVERRITPRTKAIMPVHLYGNPADLDRLVSIAQRHNLVLIEDACQAHGATWRGQPVGSFGTGCFSFYPTKNITTGEGGIITTNDAELAAHARLLRAHGMPQRYHHDFLGYNFRLSNIHAAIGLVQLNYLEDWTARRQKNASILCELLDGSASRFQSVLPQAQHVYHQFTVRIPDQRDRVAARLRERGIGCEIYYPIPIHQQVLYRNLGYDDHLPVTEQAAQDVLSLPIHPSLDRYDLATIALAVGEAVADGQPLLSQAVHD
jgi:dTDP-4-amino-4,6-dideoxygalactose transaminase